METQEDPRGRLDQSPAKRATSLTIAGWMLFTNPFASVAPEFGLLQWTMRTDIPPPDDVKGDDDALSKANARFGAAVAASMKRAATLFWGWMKIMALRHLQRPRSQYRLGAKSYGQRLGGERFEALFQEIERLQAQEKADDLPSAVPPPQTHIDQVKKIGRAALAKARAVRLRLRLYPRFVALGTAASSPPIPELEPEQSQLRRLEEAIAAAEASRAQTQSADTAVRRSALELGTLLRARLQRTLTRLARPVAEKIDGYRKRIAGTPLGRIKRRHLVGGGALLLIALLAWAGLHYRSERENDPVAVAQRAHRLAAHSDDPTKPTGVAGVSDDDLRVPKTNARALDACMRAVELLPDDPALLFELGRVLLLAGETDDAREFLEGSAELGHIGGQAYLGRLESDPDKALEIFRQAASDGFSPAAQMASEMEVFINRVLAEAGQKADELAAHPDDPAKPKNIKGVSDEALASEAALENAVQACVQAATLFPDEPRYQFELGRVLLLAGADEAAAHLKRAAEKDYAAACAHLARLEENLPAATAYLKRAEQGGFLPAKKMLADIQAEVGPDFQGDGYHFGDVLRALFDKNVAYLEQERWQNLHYVWDVNDGFKISAATLFDADLTRKIQQQASEMRGKSEGELTPAEMLGALLTNRAISRELPELNPDHAKLILEDVARLASTYGAESPILKRIAEGMKAYVR